MIHTHYYRMKSCPYCLLTVACYVNGERYFSPHYGFSYYHYDCYEKVSADSPTLSTNHVPGGMTK